MEYIGYGFAILMGIILGLTGGGGSILTVPILVYVIQLNPVTATAYSLFIVGTTSALGTVQNFRKQLVEARTALRFAVPSLIGVYLSRKFLIPAIPEVIADFGNIVLTKNTALMLIFALVILWAGISMLRKSDNPAEASLPSPNPVITGFQLFAAGALVGLIGAGGGFLFTPLLLYVARLGMKKAVATSMLIIAINSLLGFTGDIGNITIDWGFLFMFTSFSVAGVFIGIFLGRFVNDRQLKKGFGWFVLAMALFILLQEIVF